MTEKTSHTRKDFTYVRLLLEKLKDSEVDKVISMIGSMLTVDEIKEAYSLSVEINEMQDRMDERLRIARALRSSKK